MPAGNIALLHHGLSTNPTTGNVITTSQTAVPLNHISRNDGGVISLVNGNNGVRLNEAGKYLITFTVGAAETAAPNQNFRSIVNGYLVLNSFDGYARARNTGYIRRQQGVESCQRSTTYILDAAANDIISLQVDYKDQLNGAQPTTKLIPYTTGMQIVKLDDSWDIAALERNVELDSYPLQTSPDTWRGFGGWNVQKSFDSASYIHTLGTDYLQVKQDGWYIVSYNATYKAASQTKGRLNAKTRIVTTDNNDITPPAETPFYISGNDGNVAGQTFDDMDLGNASAVMLVYLKASSRVSLEDKLVNGYDTYSYISNNNSDSLGRNKYSFLQILRLPSTINKVLLSDSSNTQRMDLPFTTTWNSVDSIEAPFGFNGTSLIDVDTAGDYLFLYQFDGPIATTTQSPVMLSDNMQLFKNATALPLSNEGDFSRGFLGVFDDGYSFYSGGSAAQISSAAINDTFKLNHTTSNGPVDTSRTYENIAIQGIQFASLFPTLVPVSEEYDTTIDITVLVDKQFDYDTTIQVVKQYPYDYSYDTTINIDKEIPFQFDYDTTIQIDPPILVGTSYDTTINIDKELDYQFDYDTTINIDKEIPFQFNYDTTINIDKEIPFQFDYDTTINIDKTLDYQFDYDTTIDVDKKIPFQFDYDTTINIDKTLDYQFDYDTAINIDKELPFQFDYDTTINIDKTLDYQFDYDTTIEIDKEIPFQFDYDTTIQIDKELSVQFDYDTTIEIDKEIPFQFDYDTTINIDKTIPYQFDYDTTIDIDKSLGYVVIYDTTIEIQKELDTQFDYDTEIQINKPVFAIYDTAIDIGKELDTQFDYDTVITIAQGQSFEYDTTIDIEKTLATQFDYDTTINIKNNVPVFFEYDTELTVSKLIDISKDYDTVITIAQGQSFEYDTAIDIEKAISTQQDYDTAIDINKELPVQKDYDTTLNIDKEIPTQEDYDTEITILAETPYQSDYDTTIDIDKTVGTFILYDTTINIDKEIPFQFDYDTTIDIGKIFDYNFEYDTTIDIDRFIVKQFDYDTEITIVNQELYQVEYDTTIDIEKDLGYSGVYDTTIEITKELDYQFDYDTQIIIDDGTRQYDYDTYIHIVTPDRDAEIKEKVLFDKSGFKYVDIFGTYIDIKKTAVNYQKEDPYIVPELEKIPEVIPVKSVEVNTDLQIELPEIGILKSQVEGSVNGITNVSVLSYGDLIMRVGDTNILFPDKKGEAIEILVVDGQEVSQGTELFKFKILEQPDDIANIQSFINDVQGKINILNEVDFYELENSYYFAEVRKVFYDALVNAKDATNEEIDVYNREFNFHLVDNFNYINYLQKAGDILQSFSNTYVIADYWSQDLVQTLLNESITLASLINIKLASTYTDENGNTIVSVNNHLEPLSGQYPNKLKQLSDGIMNMPKDNLESGKNAVQLKSDIYADINFTYELVADKIRKLGLLIGNKLNTDYYREIYLALQQNSQAEYEQITTTYLEAANVQNDINEFSVKFKESQEAKPVSEVGERDEEAVMVYPVPQEPTPPAEPYSGPDAGGDINYRENPTDEVPTASDKEYWEKFMGFASLIGLAPNFWQTGFIAPSPTGPVAIPFPILYQPMSVISLPNGLFVIGTSVCGLMVAPFIYCINPTQVPLGIVAPGNGQMIFSVNGTSTPITDMGTKTAPLPLMKQGPYTIDVDPELSKSMPFIQDDMPPWERLSIDNLLFVAHLTKWCERGKQTQGIPGPPNLRF